MQVFNSTRNSLLVATLELANTPVSRMRGLLGREELKAGDGLLISPCNSIHMFFMRFAIDAVFMDRQNRVVGLVAGILPWRLSPIFWQAEKVLEIPAGTIQRTNTAQGDQIHIQ